MLTAFTMKITRDAVCGYLGDDFYTVSSAHPQFEQIKRAVIDNHPQAFLDAYSAPRLPSAPADTIEDPLIIDRDTVIYRDRIVTDPVLVKIIQDYGTVCDAVKKFVDRLFLNPSWDSVKMLLSFLEHGNFPLTEDGCFLGYKGVTEDHLDCHTRTFDNSVGATNVMPRSEVTFDPDVECSAGFHVGTYSYAKSFGSKVMIVKVDPIDCVSVPRDHNAQKLRCSRYTVIADCANVLPPTRIFDAEGKKLFLPVYFADVRKEYETHEARPEYTADGSDASECPHCGSEVDLDWTYCSQCGERIEGDDDDVTGCPSCSADVNRDIADAFSRPYSIGDYVDMCYHEIVPMFEEQSDEEYDDRFGASVMEYWVVFLSTMQSVDTDE